MSDLPPEPLHEIHNRLAIEIVQRIMSENPMLEDRLVLLGSIVKAVIAMSHPTYAGRSIIAAILIEDIDVRLEEIQDA